MTHIPGNGTLSTHKHKEMKLGYDRVFFQNAVYVFYEFLLFSFWVCIGAFLVDLTR